MCVNHMERQGGHIAINPIFSRPLEGFYPRFANDLVNYCFLCFKQAHQFNDVLKF